MQQVGQIGETLPCFSIAHVLEGRAFNKGIASGIGADNTASVLHTEAEVAARVLRQRRACMLQCVDVSDLVAQIGSHAVTAICVVALGSHQGRRFIKIEQTNRALVRSSRGRGNSAIGDFVGHPYGLAIL